MNAYEQKIEDRKARLLAKADKLDAISKARYKAARSIMDMIPLGQPILVGHHSEKGHRRDIERIDTNMRKAFEAQNRAGRLREIASGVGSNGISSDDPEAPDKIAERIEALERQHALRVRINKMLRTGDDAGILALGTTPEQLAALKTPDCLGRIGFADYQLQNARANIRRLQMRLTALKAAAKRETREVDLGNGVRQVENVEDNRLQLFFPGKPADHIRKSLKGFGFRWAPSVGAWQRQLTGNARYAADSIARMVGE